MSDPKLVSPLLDRFAIGSAISDHDGVRCYPAMREDSDDKYIVKVITIPASSVQLDALLLTGAYPDAGSARTYFESLVNDVENEAQVLHHFAKLDGFLAYDGYQVEPLEDGIGFEVYLLGSYKRSLAKYFKSKPMTHLGAVNLGIDLCAAMTVCRQAGCLYIDLKPENIFITDDGRYRVGDLGFVPMSSLKYATVPDKYRSSYTAPELDDPFATLNTAVDIYAIGLILYQAYNNGALPFEGKAPAVVLPPPLYADYEMADIILKACAPNPDDRWQDPKQLGQALVAYMQRNGANDMPIVPPSIPVVEPEAAVEDPAREPAAAEPDELEFISGLVSDETAPSEENGVNLDGTAVTDELSDILAQAEELLAHELPAPAVAPDPIDIPMPEPILPEPEQPEEDDDLLNIDLIIADAAEPDDEAESASEDSVRPKKSNKTVKTILTVVIWLLVIAGLAFCGYYYYSNYYLQNVDNLTVDGKDDTVSILIDSQADEALLTVICTDTYGTTRQSPVKNGTASFSDLNPGSQYTIHVEISGFHKLTGNTSTSYATPLETNILNFSSAVGSEDGSVVLSFTVDGQDTDTWNIVYSAEGEDEKTVTFSGHTATVSGLTVGKEYTFRLVPDDELYLIGSTELTFVAPKLIFAENLAVTACDGESLSVSWNAPADTTVSSWSVRCYNDSGYDTTMEVQDCSATFTGIDTSSANTIEVTASGMLQCSRTFITANPITITDISGSNSDPNVLNFQWNYIGNAPAEGWILIYSIEDSEKEEVLQCDTNTADIDAVIPGATYHLTIQAANGATLFGGRFSSTVPEATSFASYGVSAGDMEFAMCRTPDVDNWKRSDLADEDYMTDFAAGESASFLVHLTEEYNISYDEIVTLYVIRDAAGKLVSADTQNRLWVDMWRSGYCELDIPAMPKSAGDYTVEIYFNGAYITTQNFTVH